MPCRGSSLSATPAEALRAANQRAGPALTQGKTPTAIRVMGCTLSDVSQRWAAGRSS
jgi:hypothetical protein